MKWRGIALLASALLGACVTTPPPPADIAILGTRVFPESLTADSLGTLYIGSNAGTIYRARSGDMQAAPWIVPSAANGLQSVFGVLVDEQRQRLWVCSDPRPGGGGRAELKAFDLATGTLKASYPFPGEDPALCNDIAIEGGGRVFATDTLGGRIVTLSTTTSALAEWGAAPEMRGIDGIAIDSDGTIYVNNVQKSWLARVERAGDGSFARLAMVATSLPLSGPDGLRPLGHGRFLQAEGPGGRVALLTIAGDRAELRTLASGINYPASMALVGRTVYVPEGKIDYLINPAKRGQDPGPFTIHAVPLR